MRDMATVGKLSPPGSVFNEIRGNGLQPGECKPPVKAQLLYGQLPV